MFVVGDVLVSDNVLDAAFTCHLGACGGACCVHGERGAPLDEDEADLLERALPTVADELRPEARAVIDERGVWERHDDGELTTTTVGGRECVFVVYEPAHEGGPPVALCALQRAYQQGRVGGGEGLPEGFPKPVSCHLYPLRAETHAGGFEVLNYERIDLCAPGREEGRRRSAWLLDVLRVPLVRKYGEMWYDALRQTARQRLAPTD